MQDSPRDYSLRRLKQLGKELDAGQLLDGHPLCVYVTGSYGRLEAWEKSDIDPFFLYDSADETERFPWTSFVRLSARLIDVADEMDFPPFSKDGKYLEVQYVSRMERVLGSPSDDSLNAFTARMLLLLESQPLHDEDVYLRLLKRIIGFYYRDFEDYAESFLPTFLVNDILRFWRTLTLNYEHHRLGLGTALTDGELAEGELRDRKANSALKNYKLKVSRLSTCFSMVANLSAMSAPVKPEQIFDLCRITPAERFARLSSHSAASGELIGSLGTVYGGISRSGPARRGRPTGRVRRAGQPQGSVGAGFAIRGSDLCPSQRGSFARADAVLGDLISAGPAQSRPFPSLSD